MTPKIGRPKKDNSRTDRVDTRLTKEEVEKLNYCCEVLGLTKAEVVREGINKIYEELKLKERSKANEKK